MADPRDIVYPLNAALPEVDVQTSASLTPSSVKQRADVLGRSHHFGRDCVDVLLFRVVVSGKPGCAGGTAGGMVRLREERAAE